MAHFRDGYNQNINLGNLTSFFSCYSSVMQSCLILPPHGLQHAIFPCPSPSPRVCSNSTESVMLSNHLILCCLLLLLSSIFLRIRVFSNESALRIRWPKYCSFSLSISPSNEYSGPIAFRIDWFDLLVVQGTLNSLLYLHSWKALVIWCSAFFAVQLSHPYMTTGEIRALTTDLCRQSNVSAF